MNGMTKKTVLGELEQHREELRRFGVRRIGLFGSGAREQLTAASDLDFVVEFERKSFDAYMDTKEFLERLFGRKVDLVLPETIKPRLRPVILQETVYAEGF